MPIITNEELAQKLGPVRYAQFVEAAKVLRGRGMDPEQIAAQLMKDFTELVDWLPPLVRVRVESP